MIKVTQNFSWEETKNKKICIFMPNYHDQEYTKFSIKKISTEIDKKDYIIIIGNDNNKHSFDDMKEYNAFYFTLHHNSKEQRNGCFIRNYAIKRCESELFFQKDGEVVILGDFIKNCIQVGSGWRAGRISVLNEQQTNDYIVNNDTSFLKTPIIIKKHYFPPDKADKLKKALSKGNIPPVCYFHYAFCSRTEFLKKINGYDERYFYYGFEDTDLYCRLIKLGHFIVPDYNCQAIHLHHERGVLNKNKFELMKGFFNASSLEQVERNSSGWGDGVQQNSSFKEWKNSKR